jgi:hypothetical protein
VAAAASKQIMRSEPWQKVSDRFQNWYEADAPDGMVVQSVKPSPAPARPNAPSVALGAPDQISDSDIEAEETPAVTQPVRTPVVSRPAPRPVPARPPVSRPPAPQPTATDPDGSQQTPGKLWVSSQPWGILYVDGRPVGNTPQIGMSLDPGTRSIRITHDGFMPFERVINVGPGQEIRLTGIVLQEAKR